MMEMNASDPIANQMDISNNITTPVDLLRFCEDDPLFGESLQPGTHEIQAFESLLYMPTDQEFSLDHIEMFHDHPETQSYEPQWSQSSHFFEQTATITPTDPSLSLAQSNQLTAQENSFEDTNNIPTLSAQPNTLTNGQTHQENRLQNIAPAPCPPNSISPLGAYQTVPSHATPSQNGDTENTLPSTSTSSESASATSCPECDKSFNRQSDLRKHRKYHNRPTKCAHCEYATGYPRDLRRHMEAWHPNTVPKSRAICPVESCRKEFTRPDNMRRHLKNKHAVNLSE